MKSKSNRSFSLIEILITVSILSIATVFIFRSFTACLVTARFSQNITLACFLTENKFLEIVQGYRGGFAPTGSGIETIQARPFNWQYEILDTDITGLKELKFSVSWKEKSREKDYSIEFLTYLPR